MAALPLLAPHGPGNLAPADLFMLAAIAASLLWAGASRHPLRFPYAAAMGLFIACGTLAAMIGPVPGNGLVAVLQDVWLLVWCWAIANLASSAKRLRVLLATWAYAAVAWTGLLFAGLFLGTPWLTGKIPSEASRTALTFGDPSYSANYYVISIMVIWASGVPRRRGARVAAYALLVAAIASTGSNSGTVALIVATTVAAILGIHQRAGTVAAVAATACVVLVGAGVAGTISLHNIQRSAHGSSLAFVRDGIGRSSVSVSQRSSLRRESLPLYRDGGAFGQGPASTKARLHAEGAPFVKEAHNDYAAALIERGLLGLGALCALVIGLMLHVPQLARSRLAPAFASVVPRPHALVGALAGTLVAMTTYELLHLRHLWAFFGLLAAIWIWGRR